MVTNVKERLVKVDLIKLRQRKEEEDGKRVFRGTYSYESGKTQSGIVKVFPHLLLESAKKEQGILERLNVQPNIESARVLDTRDAQELGFDGGGLAILESAVDGDPLALHVDPMSPAEVRQRSINIFEQLRIIGSDPALIAAGFGYCGDVSSANTLVTEEGNFCIVDWGTHLGANNPTERLTRRYVAPELVSEHAEEILFVHADTFSLGCVLARALLGRDGYAELVPLTEDKHHFLNFQHLKNRVDSGVHGFFRIALAHDPRERSPEGAETADEHYHRLGLLFRGIL